MVAGSGVQLVDWLRSLHFTGAVKDRNSYGFVVAAVAVVVVVAAVAPCPGSTPVYLRDGPPRTIE